MCCCKNEPKKFNCSCVKKKKMAELAKEAKPKAPKGKKPKSSKPSAAPTHPPYFQMITEAIQALKEKMGSSPYAIAKYMEEKHKGVLPANFRKILAVQLKNSAAKGKLVKVKNSFKLSDSGKKGEKKLKKPAAEKKKKKVKAVSGTKRKAPAKAAKAKKPVVKKAKKVALVKAKQPKSIKSSAGKRARKAAAA